MSAATTDTTHAPMTTHQIARHFGCERWQLLSAVKRGYVPEPPRCGMFRAWTAEHLPAVEAGLRRAGYLTTETQS